MARAINLKKRSKLIAALLLGGLLLSCGGSLCHSYRSVGGAWHKADTLVFEQLFEWDGPAVAELYAGVRYSASYPYKNLCLLVEVMSGNDSVFKRDTLCCDLYDDDGRRNGATAGTLYQSEYFVSSVKVPYYEPFKIRLSHLMSDSLLQGVYDVGVRLASPCRHLPSGK